MLRRIHFLLLFGTLTAFCGAARAQESLDDLDKDKANTAATPSEPDKASTAAPVATGSTNGKATAEVNGYIDNRFNYGYVHTGGLVPTRDLPSITDLLEGNIQLKVSIGSKLFVYTDVSLFYQNGGLFYTEDANGNRVTVANHDVPSLRPLIVPAEIYASYTPRPWLNLLLGKKRVTWGAGFAYNPTDLINPPKDPTDPTFQRAGAWMARIEAPFQKFTLTALFSPSVLYQQSGIPYSALYSPSYPTSESLGYNFTDPPRSDAAHYLVAGRLYALLWNADFNLIYYFSNRYRGDDDFQNKSRVAVSFSRYFFTDWELHVEALLQLGTTRRYADPTVANGGTPQLQPGESAMDAVLPQLHKNTNGFYPHLIVGTRRIFSDESSLSIEYYYQADGYSPGQFQDYVRLLSRAQSLGLLSSLGLSQSMASQGGLPQKYSFDPLRRHYLIAGYSKPKIHDDFTVGLTLIAGLEDLSGLVTGSVGWNAQEWLTLSLNAFVPIRGIPVGTACAKAAGSDGKCPDGQSISEYSMFPQDFRLLFEARAYY